MSPETTVGAGLSRTLLAIGFTPDGKQQCVRRGFMERRRDAEVAVEDVMSETCKFILGIPAPGRLFAGRNSV